MRNKTLFITLVLGLGLILSMLWVLGARVSTVAAATAAQGVPSSNVPEAELHVCPSGCPYSSVQTAVDAASEGDIIKVAAGNYTGVSAREGVTQVVYISKSVTLQGGYTTGNWITPDPEVNITTLDAQGQGRVLYVTGQIKLTIMGLHITGGDATGLGGGEPWAGDVGGGIYLNTNTDWREVYPTLKDNHIYANTAQTGGGGYLAGSGAILDGNTITSNTGLGQGGGIFLKNGSHLLTKNVFTGNTAVWGGGLDVNWATVILNGNTFISNTANDLGGGLFMEGSSAELSANVFDSNTAQRGGGLAILRSHDVTLVNTVIADNQASIEGTGIYISGGDPLYLRHTTLARNSGGDGSGMAIAEWNPWSETKTSTVDLWDTIVASQTIGLSVSDGSVVVGDSILWHSVAVTLTEAPEADVLLINLLTGDPAFADPDNGDYHLIAASAARDTGVNADVSSDLDGLVRPMGFGYDLGAYEYHDAALSLYKVPDLSGANVGEELIYTIIMTSSGTQDSSNVVLTDTLEAWQRVTAVESPVGNCTIEDAGWGGRVVCSPGDLNIGDVITIALTAEVSAAAPLGQAMTNTLTARADEAANSTQAVVYAQDCYVRIDDITKTYTSVQAAVDAAWPGALVKVAGTCMGVYGSEGRRQQVYLDQPLTLQGGYTPSNWTEPNPEANITTLDARGVGRVMFIEAFDWTEEVVIVIDGLHLTGGNGYWQMGGHHPDEKNGNAGGGVYVYGADPVFSNDHIYGNTSSSGGGLFGSFAYLTFLETTFTSNTALGDGGGLAVHAEGSNLIDTRFEANSAENGGGFAAAVFGGGDFTRCTFVGNHANGFGGGLALETAAWLRETLILSNTAERGGGVGFYGMSPFSPYATLINTVIAGNQADLEGSGVFIPSGIEVHMLHTTLADNNGGDDSGLTLGWYPWQSPGASTLVMTNTILAYQAVGIQVSDASNITVNGVLWHADPITVSQSVTATVVVHNQHTGNPAFVNPAGGDYHIGETSAARDAGVDSDVTIDIDGQMRPMGLGWDLGADEYLVILYKLYLSLVLHW